MSERAAGPGRAGRIRSETSGAAGIPARAVRAYKELENDQRLAAVGAIGLVFTMFLPWYEKSFFVVADGKASKATDSISAWGAFSFVEAAVLLVAAALLYFLLVRAELRAFHLPGGDGTIIMGAGVWVALLILIRFFDKPDVEAAGRSAATIGIQWGIFSAWVFAGLIAFAGFRIRVADRPEPEIRGWAEDAQALEFDEVPTRRLAPDEGPTRRLSPEEEASRKAAAAALRESAPLPEVDAPPEFAYGETDVTEPEPSVATEALPEPPPRPRQPRPPKPPSDADRLF